jgi:hypothetical protein
MTSSTTGGEPRDLVRAFESADTQILDARSARAMRERLELHLLAIQVLQGQGHDHSEAFRIVRDLTDEELWTIVRGPA